MKPIWVVLITVLVTGGLVGGGTYYFLNEQAKQDKKELTDRINTLEANKSALETNISAMQQASEIETGPSGSTAGWETYTDTANKFSFKYPKDFNLMNERGTYSETKPNISLDSGDINNVAEADGACGSASSSLYKAQAAAFDSVKEGESFDKAYSTTDLNTAFSKIILNSSGIKFARGIQLCQGIVEPTDKVGYKFMAVTYKNNYRYEFLMSVPESVANVLAKDSEEKARLIDQGKSTGGAQTAYDDFKLIVDSFRFL